MVSLLFISYFPHAPTKKLWDKMRRSFRESHLWHLLHVIEKFRVILVVKKRQISLAFFFLFFLKEDRRAAHVELYSPNSDMFCYSYSIIEEMLHNNIFRKCEPQRVRFRRAAQCWKFSGTHINSSQNLVLRLSLTILPVQVDGHILFGMKWCHIVFIFSL